jgi:hypothetical protein
MGRVFNRSVLAIVLLIVCQGRAIAEGAAEPPEHLELKRQMLDAWRAREAAVRSIWVKWNIKSVMSKHVFLGVPGAIQPKEDVREQHDGLSIGWDGQRMFCKWFMGGSQATGAVGLSRFATDGKNSSDYYPTVLHRPGQAVIRENAEWQRVLQGDLDAIVYVYRPATFLLHNRDETEITISEIESADGRVSTFWANFPAEDGYWFCFKVSAADGFVPIQYEGRNLATPDIVYGKKRVLGTPAYTGTRTIVKYGDQRGGLPRIATWVSEGFWSDQQLKYRTESVVTSFDLNPEIPESEFDPMNLPLNTLIVNDGGDPEYVLGEGGARLPYVKQYDSSIVRTNQLRSALASSDNAISYVFVVSLLVTIGISAAIVWRWQRS